jgi:hypothetical protein
VTVADEVSASLVEEFVDRVGQVAERQGLPVCLPDNVEVITKEFRRGVPTRQAYPLTDFMNAGWTCHEDPTLWEHVPEIPHDERQRILAEIILKSIEVAEISERLTQRNDPESGSPV